MCIIHMYVVKILRQVENMTDCDFIVRITAEK